MWMRYDSGKSAAEHFGKGQSCFITLHSFILGVEDSVLEAIMFQIVLFSSLVVLLSTYCHT